MVSESRVSWTTWYKKTPLKPQHDENSVAIGCSALPFFEMASEDQVRGIVELDDQSSLDKHDAVNTAKEVPGEDAADLAESHDTIQPFDWTWRSLRQRPKDLDAIATPRSVFDDPDLARFYAPSSQWENFHRFDPNERWTYREQISLRHKIDLRILLWVLVMFFGLNLDRGNLTLAIAGGLLGDINATTVVGPRKR